MQMNCCIYRLIDGTPFCIIAEHIHSQSFCLFIKQAESQNFDAVCNWFKLYQRDADSGETLQEGSSPHSAAEVLLCKRGHLVRLSTKFS